MKSNISYNLFRNRKKFNPLILFYQNKEITYEEFKEYLNSRHVESPGEDYFNRVKHTFFEKSTLQKKAEEVDVVEKEDIIEESKPKRKRKRKNKNEN
jgi:hypothetical protein